MARDVQKRIAQLRTRRSGADRLDRLNEEAQREVLRKNQLTEGWLRRATNKPNTQYTLGAMQEVDPDYTRISRETADRVANQLAKNLPSYNINVEFQLQGSVPLNIHIRGVSDVDLLTLHKDFLIYNKFGPRSASYTPSGSGRTSKGVLESLRSASELVLDDKFPGAKVDKSGGKAISISGGSLARPVDVVPSHWYDTEEYQATGLPQDRGVTILDRKASITIDNWPFKHIHRINEADGQARQGLKKAIRLCKNVKNDAESEGTKITLPSFDIASTMYHANKNALANGVFYELAILAETQRHLELLRNNKAYAQSLDVPDGSRRIFDTEAKFDGLVALSTEIDELAFSVAREQNPFLSPGPLSDSRNTLEGTSVPR